MWTIIFSKNFELAVVILLVVCASPNSHVESYCSVPKDKIPSILTLLLVEGRSNYEGIRTWQGEADFKVDIIYQGENAKRVLHEKTKDKGEIPKIVRKRKVGNIQFIADFEKRFIYEKLDRPNPVQYTEYKTGRDLGTKSPLPWHTVSVITPEHFIQSAPSVYDGTSIKKRKVVRVESQKGSSCAESGVFDPRKCFGVSGTVWQTLSMLIQEIQEKGKFSVGEYDLRVEERTKDSKTEYRIRIPLKSPQTYAFLTMVFSGSKGFNIISHEIKEQHDKLFQKFTWDYELIDGVYLPTKTEKRNFDRQTGQLKYQEVFVYRNNKLNQPIPAETFEYTNLGLKEGDIFLDEILDKEYRYEAATKKLILVEK